MVQLTTNVGDDHRYLFQDLGAGDACSDLTSYFWVFDFSAFILESSAFLMLDYVWLFHELVYYATILTNSVYTVFLDG